MKNEYTKDLHEAIKKLGGQKAVSNRFKIPYRTVQNWYRGVRNPPEYVALILIDHAEEKIIHELHNEDSYLQYTRDQEALGWYNDELDKVKAENAVLQKQFDAAMELAQNRRREVEALDMEVCELREMVEALQHELEKQKKAREVWVRQAGMLTK